MELDKEFIKQHLMTHCSINPTTNCWEWTGCRRVSQDKFELRYGQIYIEKHNYRVHRLAAFIYELKDSNDNLFTLDSKLHVLHRCDNRICFNPEHLWIGTNQDNVDDKIRKGRANSGPKLLSEIQFNLIKECFQKKYSIRTTCKLTGKGRVVIRRVFKEFREEILNEIS